MPHTTNRILLRIGLTWIAGFLSFAVLGCGLYLARGIDLRMNPVLSISFCVLPILSFPVFLVSIPFRKAAVLQPVLAVAFFAVYAVLNWRTCSGPGYCGSAWSVIWLTLTTPVSMVFFAGATASVAALALNELRKAHTDPRRVIPGIATATR